ncbi:hypothetical protein Cni_G09628 [Canna indica]|uniref:MULE transposase domain-containing protein n=1 Tax=Canna indica TaxID=4628 RepID=A0AAQ3Q9U1_9LILI|nr:hypothetical protein Cni_G09628 [Canna indica]
MYENDGANEGVKNIHTSDEEAETYVNNEEDVIPLKSHNVFTFEDVNCVDFDFTDGQYEDIGDHDCQVEEEDDTLVFFDRDSFKSALTNFCIKQNFELRRIQSNSHYIKIRCKQSNCCWTLSASGRENRLFPVAFAMTEIEKIETREWFLDELYRCIPGYRGLSIMSDRNPDIIAAMRNVFLDAAHGYCMVHLAKNLVDDVHSKDVVPLFWAAARSTTEHSFN